MKMMISCRVVAVTLSLLSTASFAQSGRSSGGYNPLDGAFPAVTQSAYNTMSPAIRDNIRLRDEALGLQRKDGGELTPDHVRYLQAKLIRLQSAK